MCVQSCNHDACWMSVSPSSSHISSQSFYFEKFSPFNLLPSLTNVFSPFFVFFNSFPSRPHRFRPGSPQIDDIWLVAITTPWRVASRLGKADFRCFNMLEGVFLKFEYKGGIKSVVIWFILISPSLCSEQWALWWSDVVVMTGASSVVVTSLVSVWW